MKLLRIINKTDDALSIENFELPENSSIDIDIPYTSNLKHMEKCNMIAVLEIPDVEEPTAVQSEIVEQEEVKPRKRNKKTTNN